MNDVLRDPSRLTSESRLGVLRLLGLLDAPPEESFDRLTRLATRLTTAPVALAVLVDEDRQFFVSQVGLGEPWASLRQTPLSHSFCQHVVTAAAPLLIADAREDDLVVNNLAIDDLGVVAYAGVPLVCDNEVLGSFCLIDSQRREWTDEELSVLRDLAGAAMAEMSLRVVAAQQDALLARVSESEERYRSVVSAMSEGVVLQQADGAITACNEAAAQMLGLTVDQMMGRTSMDPRWRAVHEDGSDFPGLQHPAIRTLAAGEPIRDEVLGVHQPGGELRWLSVSTEPMFQPGGLEPYAVVSSLSDITDRMRADAERARHTSEQEALRAVATLVAGEAPPGAVFAAAAEHVAKVFDAIVSGVVRAEPTGEARLVGVWGRAGLPVPSVGEVVDVDGSSALAQVVRTRRPAIAMHADGPPTVFEQAAPLPVRSGLAAPIEVDGRFWGAVSVGWHDAVEPDDEAIRRITRFADLLSLAVTGAEAREQLSRMASTDHLTGLCNQRAFADRLAEEVQRAARHGRPLSLIVLDLDHFKLVNDTHGHEAGNRALAEFAARLKDIRRGGDVIARVGGEEFAWILPETDRAGALIVAERARRATGDSPFAGIGRVTTSVGLCSLEHAADADDLYRHADLALYWAKANGRNATVTYTPETMSQLPPDEQAHRLEDAKTLAAVRALAAAVDAKDSTTQRHSGRVAALAAQLARVAGWEPSRVALLHEAALVHDVGKIGVPDQILLKAGPLSAVEGERVRAHAALSAEIVTDLLTPEQVSWIGDHHERLDGAGYPNQLAGTEINEGARLLAVADAWDAMTVARPYGPPRPTEDAIAQLRDGLGTQFCPDAVQALLALQEQGALANPR